MLKRSHKLLSVDTRRFIVAALAAGAVCLAAGRPAGATPAGLTFYPSTDIYGKGVFHFDADSFGKGVRMDALTSVGLTYGVGPDRDGAFGRSEAGFDYLVSVSGATPQVRAPKRLLFNAKTQLYNNDAAGTRVVAGIWGVGSNSVAAPKVGYLLGSKNFKFGRVHLGLAQALGRKANVATPAGNSDRTYLQLGYDKLFNPKWQFTLDYYSGKSAISALAPGIIYYVNDKAAFQLGWIRYNDKSMSQIAPANSRNQIYLAFDYNFGGSPAAAPTPDPSTAAPPAGAGQ